MYIYAQIRARSRIARGGKANAQKQRKGAERIRNFPRISRINEKCQIFRRAAREYAILRLYFLYFAVPPDAAVMGKKKK